MAVTRERDGEAAAAAGAGQAAFWAGEPYRADRSGDWSAGWLAAAAAARRQAVEASALVHHRPQIADAMRAAYAASKRLAGRMKVLPGDRAQLESAAVKLGATLPYVESPAADATGPRRT